MVELQWLRSSLIVSQQTSSLDFYERDPSFQIKIKGPVIGKAIKLLYTQDQLVMALVVLISKGQPRPTFSAFNVYAPRGVV